MIRRKKISSGYNLVIKFIASLNLEDVLRRAKRRFTRMLNFIFEIKIDARVSSQNDNEESIAIGIPQVRGLRNILFNHYRYTEFKNKDEVDVFKRFYKDSSVNSHKLAKDCQLFEALLEIPSVNKVSIIYNNTICIEKQTSRDWEEINKVVQKSICEFLEISPENGK